MMSTGDMLSGKTMATMVPIFLGHHMRKSRITPFSSKMHSSKELLLDDFPISPESWIRLHFLANNDHKYFDSSYHFEEHLES